jgi:cytochrome c2
VVNVRKCLVVVAAGSCAVILLGACREDGVVPRQHVRGGDHARGKRMIVAYGCGSCHVIPGVPAAEGRVGPALTDLAERTYIAGRLPNEASALVRWIRTPRAVDPGTAMPDLGVSEKDARDIAAYLYTLGGDRLGPPRLFPAWTLGH